LKRALDLLSLVPGQASCVARGVAGQISGFSRAIGRGPLFAAPADRSSLAHHVAVIIAFSGAGVLTRTSAVTMPSCSAALVDFLLPWSFDAPDHDAVVLAAIVDRHPIPSHLLAALEDGPILLTSDSLAARTIAAFVAAAWDRSLELDETPGGHDEAAACVDDAALALAAILTHVVRVESAAPRLQSPSAAGKLQQICRFIDRHLMSDALTPDLIAGEFGLSRAVLYRAFAPLGGVTTFIRKRRLGWARLQLETAGASPSAIAEVARRLGFAGAGAFSRAYKEQFGHSPASIRLRARPRAPAGAA